MLPGKSPLVLTLPFLMHTGCGEKKYLSTSTGQIRIVCERAASLGMGYWKEVGRSE